MNIAQLITLALSCHREYREPNDTEYMHLCIFYKTQIENKMSVTEFLADLDKTSDFVLLKQDNKIILFVEVWLRRIENKEHQCGPYQRVNAKHFLDRS